MKKAIINFCIEKILKWFHGITPTQFAIAQHFVRTAEENYKEASDKWIYVKDAMLRYWEKTGVEQSSSATNLLIELAVSWVTGPTPKA